MALGFLPLLRYIWGTKIGRAGKIVRQFRQEAELDDELKELRRDLRTIRERRNYFLMSASGACIGFAITQMDFIQASLFNWLLLFSLVLWSLSFYSGYQFMKIDEKFISANSAYLQSLSLPEAKILGKEQVKMAFMEVVNPIGDSLEVWRKIQIGSLILGAISFVLWKFEKCEKCFAALWP